MKLSVPRLTTKRMPVKKVMRALDSLPRTPLDSVAWKEFPLKPAVNFTLAYGDDAFYIKFRVSEDEVLALYSHPSQPVCRDSCVEFFVSPDRKDYYNIEFNCIGACFMAVGYDRAHRRMIKPDVIEKKIDVVSTLGKRPFNLRAGRVSWELAAVIPFEIMESPRVTDVRGKTFTANFYKCGDEMTAPHYITWNPVGTPEPDYHTPEYFGEIEFV
ncbi:MAG: carbohydrate-binding family 9-like protein [Spirochaetota bacterium]